MTVRIILLAGLHKTATTSIQHACMEHSRHLSRAGYHYPVNPPRPGFAPANHTNIFHVTFRREPGRMGLASQLDLPMDFEDLDLESLRARNRGKFAELLRDARDLQRNIILSAEGVSLFDRGELADMKAFFEQEGGRVVLFCHVRHLGSWISSMVAQRVTGGPRGSIASAVQEFERAGTLVRGRIENLRAVFPDAQFHSHERAVRYPRGPAGYFLERLGIPLPPHFGGVESNRGASDLAVRFLSEVNNRMGWYRPDGSRNTERLRGRGLRQAVQAIRGPKFALRRVEAAPLAAMLHAENAWQREALGPEFADPDLRFGDHPLQIEPAALAQLRQAMQMAAPEQHAALLECLQRLRA